MGKGKGKKIFKGAVSLISGIIGIKNPAVGLGIGAVKGIVGGIGGQFKKHMAKNQESEVGGVSNLDWAGLIGSVLGGAAVIFGLVLVAMGKISWEQFALFFTGKE